MRGRQPDRPAAGLRAPPPGGAHGAVRARRRARSSAARASSTWSPSTVERARAPDLPRAEVRTSSRPPTRDRARRGRGSAAGRASAGGRARARTASAGGGCTAPSCKNRCRTYVPSEPFPRLPPRDQTKHRRDTASPSGCSAASTWRSTSRPWASTASSRGPRRRPGVARAVMRPGRERSRGSPRQHGRGRAPDCDRVRGRRAAGRESPIPARAYEKEPPRGAALEVRPAATCSPRDV